ncbi:MAG: hypothetical protein Q7T80_13890, partial [Methanoregula sp.]|nr:hypothetical protein [Methanoregula sp.]
MPAAVQGLRIHFTQHLAQRGPDSAAGRPRWGGLAHLKKSTWQPYVASGVSARPLPRNLHRLISSA